MKVVVFAGGFGTRLSEETDIKPKPMVEIGGKPILWHIMKLYSSYGFNEFVILLGYKGYVIKEYFANYFLHQSDVTINFADNAIEVHKTVTEPWKVTLLDTGLNTMTGGRLKRAKEFIGNETFMLTYGDGVSDVNIHNLLEHHKKSGVLATITSVRPQGRFGSLTLDDANNVKSFQEKPQHNGNWTNAGFFVLEPQVIDYIGGDTTLWEKEPLEGIAGDGQLAAYKHYGFWKPMDTLRDRKDLESIWDSGNAPWKVW